MHSCALTTLLSTALMLGTSLNAIALEPAAVPSAVLFENVRVFDGATGKLSATTSVLVKNNLIAGIGTTASADASNVTALRIDGHGRTLMPGLIDNHWHTMLVSPTPAQILEDDIGYTHLRAAAE